jgi:Fe-S-cluster containining protein
MCGQCCRKIHFSARTCWQLKEGYLNGPEIDFINENLEYIGPSEEVGGFTTKDVKFGVYRCKLITEDNKCSVHENKPYLCSGYPWYNHGLQADKSQPWPYKGCGYERISYEMRLIVALKHRVDQLSENKQECKSGTK